MQGYLLDTNCISDWFDATRPRHAAVASSIDRLSGTRSVLVTSVVVIGEIEYGIRAASQAKAASQTRLEFFDHLRTQVQAEFVQKRLLLEVTRSTAVVFGELRAKLFGKYVPPGNRKGLRPEELVSPITSKELGIQENDLWIAAQAIERNMVLVSNDAMNHIRAVATDLLVEDWGQTNRGGN